MEKDKVDEEFVETMLEIEKSYGFMSKHEKVRIEQWSKKLCQVTANPMWKKNRNKYAKTLLQLVKLGTLQEPFTRIPPEGPLPQFTGNIYIQPPRPRPKSSAEGHLHRIPSNTEIQKPIEVKIPENKIPYKHPDSPCFEKPQIPKPIEKRNIESSSNFKNTNERYDTHITINHKVNEDLVRFQTQLEIAQLNEKHLREELGKRNKKIMDQSEEIEFLRRENENLKMKLAAKEQKREFFDEYKENKQQDFKYFLDKKNPEEKEILNIDDISDNLRRLEKLQEDLNRNRFS